MKNSERNIKKKKKSDMKKSYLISYYQERVASFSDKIYRDIKNRVIEATSKKEAYTYWVEHVQTNPSIINIICLDEY